MVEGSGFGIGTFPVKSASVTFALNFLPTVPVLSFVTTVSSESEKEETTLGSQKKLSRSGWNVLIPLPTRLNELALVFNSPTTGSSQVPANNGLNELVPSAIVVEPCFAFPVNVKEPPPAHV